MAATSVVYAKSDRHGGPPKVPPGSKLLWWSTRHPPEDPTVRFDSRTILITGANTGLGFEAALKYASLAAARLLLAQARPDGLVHMIFFNSIAHADVKREWFQNTSLLTTANDEES
ncbi:MAG: hypothetical protein Q9204_003921 [Flavoplaca sp. TL-2023a]